MERLNNAFALYEEHDWPTNLMCDCSTRELYRGDRKGKVGRLSLTVDQERLAFQRLEHEIQHRGQLIRYLYGFKIPCLPVGSPDTI